MTCGAVDKARIGRRDLWAKCGHPRGHEGTHYDRKRKHAWTETVFWDEFERGNAGLTPVVRKVRICDTCGKSECGCWAMAETSTGQTSLFQKNQLESEYERTIAYFDLFFSQLIRE